MAPPTIIRARILTGSRNEDFGVGKVDYALGLYQLRRDDAGPRNETDG